ncbi:MAG: hypothetical protein ISS77_05780 [Phycisphaerae bacterium]|nr:hypothetical protein [Phycisphaerae bacterium]
MKFILLCVILAFCIASILVYLFVLNGRNHSLDYDYTKTKIVEEPLGPVHEMTQTYTGVGKKLLWRQESVKPAPCDQKSDE